MKTLSQFARSQWTDESGQAHVVIAVEGMRCASCSRSIERKLRELEGLAGVSVNLPTGRVTIDWEPQSTSLSKIIATVESAGFRALPLAGVADGDAQIREYRTALKRLGVAGLGMMQTMMFVYGLNASATRGIDPGIAQYLRIAGMLFAVPVLFYSGQPIIYGAWRSLRLRALSMDVPISAALLLAFGASVVNTLRGSGEIYFDSVTMFIFFLLAGRFIEMRVRHGSLNASEALARSLPGMVTRIQAGGRQERVPVEVVSTGDVLLVPRGAVIPVDAHLLSVRTLVDESLLSGESTALGRRAGEGVLGGSVNLGDPIQVRASATAGDSTLTSIVRLLERAQGQKPGLALIADKVASHFVLGTLIVAAATAVFWLYANPARAFPATLAVLVVTCPCALALATPAAIAAATRRLAHSGMMVSRADALERLARVDLVVMDKTGTLTSGTPEARLATGSDGYSPGEALACAAALEQASDHPIAAAFTPHRSTSHVATEVQEFPGEGVEGRIGGQRWRLGRTDFVCQLNNAVADTGGQGTGFDVCLGAESGQWARFEVRDVIRPDALQAVGALQKLGLECVIVSGDRESEVAAMAQRLGIWRMLSRAVPERKLAFVKGEQEAGRRVLMLGDGINDGPVLGVADVSCAMGRGSAIAQSAADVLLLSESLTTVASGTGTARHMMRVMRQNMAWALCYNLATVPLAVMGRIPPSIAALGMSISSLVVVLNAARLAWRPSAARADAQQSAVEARGTGALRSAPG
jgi:P-type Cu2+ transporter